MKKHSSHWLIPCISLLFLFYASLGFCRTQVEGFTFIKSEAIGVDISGDRITKETFENEKSHLSVIITPNVKLRGKVVVVGSEPFLSLIMQTEDGLSYYFRDQDKSLYWDRQGKTIELKGRVEKRIITKKKTKKVLTFTWFIPEQ